MSKYSDYTGPELVDELVVESDHHQSIWLADRHSPVLRNVRRRIEAIIKEMDYREQVNR